MGRCFTVNPGRGSNSARPPRPLTDRGGRSRRPQGTLRPKGVSMPDTPITLVVAERSGSATTSSGFCAARGDDARVRAIVRRSPERPIPRRRDRRTRDLTSCTAGSRSRSAPVHVSGMESELLRHLAAEPTRVLTAASCCARGGASRPEATHALSTPRLPAAARSWRWPGRRTWSPTFGASPTGCRRGQARASRRRPRAVVGRAWSAVRLFRSGRARLGSAVGPPSSTVPPVRRERRRGSRRART
jgi:hypothetical protein